MNDASILPDTAESRGDDLSVGGCTVPDLAEEFGTPLYIYDEATLRNQARAAVAAFSPLGGRVSFAAKACSTLGVLRVIEETGLGLDVVSAGEIEAGRRAGFDGARMHLHGNAKSAAELSLAITAGVHSVVADSLDELRLLLQLCSGRNEVGITLRVRSSLEADTHTHLRTAGREAKFGLARDDLPEALSILARCGNLRLLGLHAHLGSQVRDPEMYRRCAEELVRTAESIDQWADHHVEISLGGGWAVRYRPGDEQLDPSQVARNVSGIFGAARRLRPAVEPGRWIVARAAVAVYRVVAIKRTDERRLIAVDGGMGDNPRPALYGARYSAIAVSRPFATPTEPADVVGRYCESGDVLVRDAWLPPMRAGDLLCIPVSGAYHLSMASPYNLVPQPAVVLVARGRPRLVTRRATDDDLFAREIDAG